jgi:CheY-like chemotaxis protein
MSPKRKSADTRVLVVDDSADNRQLIVTLLNYQGPLPLEEMTALLIKQK